MKTTGLPFDLVTARAKESQSKFLAALETEDSRALNVFVCQVETQPQKATLEP